MNNGIIGDIKRLFIATVPLVGQAAAEALFGTAEAADIAGDTAAGATGVLEAAIVGGMVLMATDIGNLLTYFIIPNNT